MARNEWRDYELGKLARLYSDPTIDIDEIMREISGRTENAIRLKASRLGIARGLQEPPASLSSLSWQVHEDGNRNAVFEDNLTLKQAVACVMENEGMAATGYRGNASVVSIKRA